MDKRTKDEKDLKDKEFYLSFGDICRSLVPILAAFQAAMTLRHPFPERCPGVLHFRPLGLWRSSSDRGSGSATAQGNALGKGVSKSSQPEGGRHFFKYVIISLLSCVCAPCYAVDSIDFDTALQRVYAFSPALKISETDLAIKEAEECQASKIPNPQLEVAIGDYWGSSSAMITQPFELGGKRAARMRVADIGTYVEEWNREILRADLRFKLRNAIIDAAAAQEKMKIATEQLKSAEEGLSVQSKNKIQQKKAEINKTSTLIAFRKANAEFEAAKKGLANLWGNPLPDFTDVAYSLDTIGTLPSFEELKERLEESPEVNKSKSELIGTYEGLSLEKANAIPDLAIGAGYLFDNHTSTDQNISVTMSIDIPLFDRNQGNIARARAEIAHAQFVLDDTRQALQAKLASVYAQVVSSYEEVISTKESLLPSQEEAFNLAKEEQQKGNADFSDVQDAQKTWQDARSDYIEKLADYHHHKAELERLIQEPL